MALYAFTVEKFHIDNTRSRGDDTDTVSSAFGVGASPAATKSIFAGDVDSGDIGVNLAFPLQFVPTDEVAVLSYFIYNGDISKLSLNLNKLAAKVVNDFAGLAEQAIASRSWPLGKDTSIPDDPGLPDNATFDDPGWIGVLAFAAIASFLFPDCDGMVAADVIGRLKSELDRAIELAGGTTYRQSRRYPGSDSPAGCGSNSDYTVTWSVTRVRESGAGPFSLRQFLSTNGIQLQPGLRSVRPRGGAVSVRDLLM